MNYVYILRCGDGTLYTGCTNDLPRRLQAHQSGRGAKYTRAHPPEAVAALWRCGDKSAAARLEYAVKTLPRAAKLALLDVPERVGQVFPALAQYDYAPVRGETLAHLLEEGSNG